MYIYIYIYIIYIYFSGLDRREHARVDKLFLSFNGSKSIHLFLNVYYSSRLDYPSLSEPIKCVPRSVPMRMHFTRILYARTQMGAYFVVYVYIYIYTHATCNDMTQEKTRCECDVLITS